MTREIPNDVRTLLDMLCWRRPAGTRTERKFIREYIMPLGVQQDAYGNLYKRIGDAPVLWSSHTDTVHRIGGIQRIAYGDNIVTVSDELSNCLGADDTTGVWLMCEMIRAERPGLYIFHRGEECGGVGSSAIAKETPKLLAGIHMAIALDRMGRQDVITHQGARCCSDVFARALGLKLGMGYAAIDGGVFTDTANYTDLVGECTNLSVGYGKQHTKSEYQDVMHAMALRDVLLTLDTCDLPVERQPGEWDPADYAYSQHYGSGGDYGAAYGSHGGFDLPDEYQQWRMCDLVEAHPTEVADILREYGVTADDLLTELYARGATVERSYKRR